MTTVPVDDGLRVMTYWQPYASWIVLGTKTVDNRPHLTRYRGVLLVHAAKKTAAGHLKADYPLGAVIGSVEIVGVHQCVSGVKRPEGTLLAYNCCRTASGAMSMEQYSGAFTAAAGKLWHWELANAHAFTEPIPWDGGRGLWRPPQDLLDLVVKQMANEVS